MDATMTSGGYEDIVFQLTSLLTAYPAPFIYVHDPMTPRLAGSAVRTALEGLQNTSKLDLRYAFIDAICCYNSRLLYDTILNDLAQWSPTWEEGCSNWGGSSHSQIQRFNESFDSFMHGLQAIQTSIRNDGSAASSGKGKGKATARDNAVEVKEVRLVILIERAERLKESMPELLVPLTRLAELSRTEVTTILLSDVSWEQNKPPLGAAPDPFFVDVGPITKQAIISRLTSGFPKPSNGSEGDFKTYHPSLKPLYTHFVTTLYSVCAPFFTDPDELAYIAASRWPGFVKPVLDEHQRRSDEYRAYRAQLREEQGEDVPDREEEEIDLEPPSEDVRIRLTRLFTPSFTAALEALYPRLTFADAWAKANVPLSDLLSIPPGQLTSVRVKIPEDQDTQRTLKNLPRMAKFILVASFLASTNPAKSDMRMFGRGPDERAKRRRKGGGTRKVAAKGAAVKIPQRLLGPIAFPMDRMIAILGVLLEENDVDIRSPAPQYTVPGEYTEMEISRMSVLSQVMELAASHLLDQTSPQDRLEMSPMFKCGIGYDAALGLARELGINLNDILWDPL